MNTQEKALVKEVLLDLIQNDPQFRYLIERNAAKIRFEKINCRYLGLCGDDCTCQK